MALSILLTNDDGYDAPGIQSMYAALTAAGYDVTVAAPKENQSAQGSSLGGEEALSAGIGVQQYDDNGNYWLDGRPAVVVDTALDALLADQAFDLLISGTNAGENIGTSENISGTVNGALAGLRHGIPSIAVSAAADEAGDEGFANAAAYTVDLVQKLESEQQDGQPLLPEGTGLSVNVPEGDVDGVALTEITRKSSAEYPIVENDAGSYGSDYIAQQSSGGLFDEGDQFLDGNITVSAIDGDWGANEQARSALETRLGDLLADGMAPSSEHAPLNIMLVNDDGYEAEGLTTTRDALLEAGYDVTVVAPTEEQHANGSALTLGEFAVTEYAGGYHVDATPSTTVYTGLDALLQGAEQPDLIVSGVDQGSSVGLQATSSGTLGAAVASVFNYAIPAIAVSAGTDDSGEVPEGLYQTSADFLVEMIGDLQATQSGNGTQLLPEGLGLNVNVPVDASADDFAFTLMDEANDGERSVASDGTGGYRYQLGDPVNTDSDWSEGTHYNEGDITITPIDGSYQASDDATLEVGELLGLDYGQVSDWSAEGVDEGDHAPGVGHGHEPSLPDGIGALLQGISDGIEQLVAGLGAQRFHPGHTPADWGMGPLGQVFGRFGDSQSHDAWPGHAWPGQAWPGHDELAAQVGTDGARQMTVPGMSPMSDMGTDSHAQGMTAMLTGLADVGPSHDMIAG